MANLATLTKLFQAIGSNDLPAAKTIASEIAQKEADKGFHSAAQVLRGALHQNGQSWTLGEPVRPGSLGIREALTPIVANARLEDVALRAPIRRLFGECINEWEHRSELEALGLHRRRTFLFHGPPGCGKSHTATALARELSIPLFVVRLEAVVGAYLGQTASRVRDIFRFAEQSPSVILLDEVDAIGRRRGGQTDVGEIDRVVISLMQELEHAEPQGLVIATSNLPEQLDGALFRRFDEVVGFPRPTRRELSQFASSMAKAHAILPPRGVAKLVAASRSYADAKRKVEDAERRMTMARLLDATKS